MRIEKQFDIQQELIDQPKSTFFMTVGSDAMIEAGIHIGDKLVIDKAKRAHHKDIVVATVAVNVMGSIMLSRRES